jgi:periplasmic divalent cation tolerance protein
MADSGYRVVLVTVPDAAAGERIAEALVGERLAACVNRLDGVRSTYRWRGAIERSGESLLVIKTRAALVADVTARVKALHPYTVPEVIALAIETGNPDYLAWLGAETRESPVR